MCAKLYAGWNPLEWAHVQRFRNPIDQITHLQDVNVRFSEKDFIYAGEVFYVTAHLENTSSESRTVQVLLLCESVHYNGQRENVLKSKLVTLVLEPGTGK